MFEDKEDFRKPLLVLLVLLSALLFVNNLFIENPHRNFVSVSALLLLIFSIMSLLNYKWSYYGIQTSLILLIISTTTYGLMPQIFEDPFALLVVVFLSPIAWVFIILFIAARWIFRSN